MNTKLNQMINKFEEMYDRYIQLLQEDRFKEAAEIGLDLVEFNNELNLLEA